MSNKALTYILAYIAILSAILFAAVSALELREAATVTQKSIDLNKLLADERLVVEQLKVKKSELSEVSLVTDKLEDKIIEQTETENKLAESVIDLSEAKMMLIDEIEKLHKTREDKKSEIAKDSDAMMQDAQEHKRLLNQIAELEAKASGLYEENQRHVFDKETLEARITELKENESVQQNTEKDLLEGLVKELKLEKLEVESSKQDYEIKNKELTKNLNTLISEKNKIAELLRVAESDLERVKKKSSKEQNLSVENSSLVNDLNNIRRSFDKLNGLRVIFSGNMIYDDARGQIVFQAENSIGIPIFQDDFTGSIAGECGLPIDEKIENRCSATIIAEFVINEGRLFLRGEEIVEIVKSQ